jgi:hypothetical protein
MNFKPTQAYGDIKESETVKMVIMCQGHHVAKPRIFPILITAGDICLKNTMCPTLRQMPAHVISLDLHKNMI